MGTIVISKVENTIQAFGITNKDIFPIGYYFLWQNMELKWSHKVAFSMELIKHYQLMHHTVRCRRQVAKTCSTLPLDNGWHKDEIFWSICETLFMEDLWLLVPTCAGMKITPTVETASVQSLAPHAQPLLHRPPSFSRCRWGHSCVDWNSWRREGLCNQWRVHFCLSSCCHYLMAFICYFSCASKFMLSVALSTTLKDKFSTLSS